MATPKATTRRHARPTPGDLTGRQSERAAREQRQAVLDHNAEASAQRQAEEVEEADGVFDAKTGLRIDSPGVVQVGDLDAEDDDLDEEGELAPPAFPFAFKAPTTEDNEPILSGKESPEVVEQLLSSRKVFSPSPTNPARMLRSSVATIRVDQDIDDMTFGMVNGTPNNYTFKEGQAYQVPIDLADHLNERGLIKQWIS